MFPIPPLLSSLINITGGLLHPAKNFILVIQEEPSEMIVDIVPGSKLPSFLDYFIARRCSNWSVDFLEGELRVELMPDD